MVIATAALRRDGEFEGGSPVAPQPPRAVVLWRLLTLLYERMFGMIQRWAGRTTTTRCWGFAHPHASTVVLAERLAGWADANEVLGAGIRTHEHRLTINAGCDQHTASELLRVGRALRLLPRIREVARSGALGYDKVRHITRVAAGADEDVWLDVAQAASGAQLARICNAYHRATGDQRSHAALHRARGLWARWSEDGMCHLRMHLPSEDAGVLLGVLDRHVRAQGEAAGDADEADDPSAARRADALLDRCVTAACSLPARLVVHVDAAVLDGTADDGRCHLDRDAAVASRARGCAAARL